MVWVILQKAVAGLNVVVVVEFPSQLHNVSAAVELVIVAVLLVPAAIAIVPRWIVCASMPLTNSTTTPLVIPPAPNGAV